MTTVIFPAVGGRAVGAAPRALRSWAWLGLLPCFAFLALFLIVPAISVFSKSFYDNKGHFGLAALKNAFRGQNLAVFKFSVWLSALSAAIGVVVGTLLAYAAATARRPKWLRSMVTSFSGVAANLGGIPLAFAFIALLGRQGLATKILSAIGIDLYGNGFQLDTTPGGSSANMRRTPRWCGHNSSAPPAPTLATGFPSVRMAASTSPVPPPANREARTRISKMGSSANSSPMLHRRHLPRRRHSAQRPHPSRHSGFGGVPGRQHRAETRFCSGAVRTANHCGPSTRSNARSRLRVHGWWNCMLCAPSSSDLMLPLTARSRYVTALAMCPVA